MKKRKLSILLVVALVLQMLPLPVGSLAGVFDIVSISKAAELSGTDGNIHWQLTQETAKDGWLLGSEPAYKLTLTGTGEMKNYWTEWYEEDKNSGYYRTTAPWKELADHIQTISIGSGITNISRYAFYNCVSALSVEIPTGVKSIGGSAFSGCNGLKQITLPQGVETIGSSAFSDCTDAETINIPSSVTSLGSSAFASCSSLKEITVPASVKEIASSVFSRCKKLEKAVISEGITSIGNSAFNNCVSLTELSLPENSLTSIGESAFSYAGLTSFTVPASVTTIGVNPFVKVPLQSIEVAQGNQNYESVNGMLVERKDSKLYKVVCYPYRGAADAIVPEGIEVIGKNAFYSIAIQSVNLPGSLLTIESYAFYWADSLKGVDVPGKVTKIDSSAFSRCSALQDVTLGGDLLTMGDSAFSNCTAISEITLPDKLTSIGSSAFYGCSKLKELTFPNSLITIGKSVLANCSVLEKVSFGQQIQTISGDVFEGCPKLAEVTISPKNEYMTAEENVVYNKEKTKLIYYAAGREDEKFLIPDTIQTVGSYAFTYCTHLTELRFPASVTSLEHHAIYYNDTISKLLFYGNAPAVTESSYGPKDENGNVTSYTAWNTSVYNNRVKNGAHDNSGLTIHKTADSTGWEDGWTGTKLYKAQEQLYTSVYKWIQKYTVIDWDPSKTDVASGDFEGLTWTYRDDIGEIVFSGEGKVPDFEEDDLPTWSNDETVDHMQDIKLVETGDATEIGNNAFRGAGKLVRILTEDKLTRIGQCAFADCTDLQIVRIPSVAQIDKEAFMGDTAIEGDLDVRGGQIIGEGAFKGCTGMTDILLGEKLNTIGKEAFLSCSALETMMLPESTVSLGEGCFSGCAALRTINIPKGITVMPALCFVDCTELQKTYFYGDYPVSWAEDCFSGTHDDLTIYYRAGNQTWSAAGNEWNGIPVVALDKFYTEKQDHYSFANTGSSFGYGSKYFIPRQRYVTALQSIIRGSYYYAWDLGWKGSCFGMAASSTEFYEGDQFDVKDYTPSAENLYDVTAPGNANADLTKLIEIYQVSQFVDEIGMDMANNYGKYRQLIKQVEEFERSGGLSVDSTADPVIMAIYSGNSGHAVVPVSVNMDQEGNYILEVYDCNNPSGFSSLKIKKDFSGIEYGRYKTASFVKYSTIRDALSEADFTGESLKKTTVESSKVSVAVNREEVNLVNGGGKDYSEIKGAYEQRPMSNSTEDEFIGIRSFVLPQGEYQIEDSSKVKADSAEEEDLKYYVSTEDFFSEVETSDTDAKLTVKSVKGEGYDTVTLSSEESDAESDLTIMDTLGIKKEISIKGSSVSVEMVDNKEMAITVSDDATDVKVDGEEVILTDNQAKISFCALEGENPMEADEVSCELSMDDQNQLSGTAEAYVTWSKEDAGDVDVITRIKDEAGNVLAESKEKRNFSIGMQKVNVAFNKIKANLGDLTGEFNAVCEMTMVDANNNKVSVSKSGLALRAAGEKATSTPSPSPTVTPTPTATPTPTVTPSPVVTQKPTVPSNPVIPSYPVVTPAPTATPTPVVTPTPEATKEPEETPSPTASPKPEVTPTPEVTPKPIVTPEPEETPKPVATKKSSLPKKGKIVTARAMKYIVVKSSKKNGTVAAYGAKKKNATKVVIPKKVKINGYSFKVESIQKNAFSNMNKLSEVTIGANVKTIGSSAFKNCKKLQFIALPKKVTTIKSKAFAGCTNLKYLLVKSDKIKSVETNAFEGITSKMTVKTSKDKWKKYAEMFMNKGKMSQNALFIIDPVKLRYKGKAY